MTNLLTISFSKIDFEQILSNWLLYDKAHPILFNSAAFFVLLIVFLVIYNLLHRNHNRPLEQVVPWADNKLKHCAQVLRNFWYRYSTVLYVVLFSFYFYYKSSGWYLLILIFTTLTDYTFAILITRTSVNWKRKLWLILSVGSSLGILFAFKYTDFLLSNISQLFVLLHFDGLVNWMIDANLLNTSKIYQPFDLFLPIGISFYTFQSISYVVDVYKKKLPPTRNIMDYAFFLTFFPQLVAGPIVKAHHFLPQLKKRITITHRQAYAGFFLIILGLLKKAVIADYISQYNDLVFANPTGYSGFENLMAVYGYALQIYCDFSGYSDIAIGLGKLMGFDLGINFNFPYQARSITDFWRRWHISLSSWLRDYLYIPLGGNRRGKGRMYLNLFITMLLGGLWHGANWRFVVWGGFHGVGLAVHKALSPWLNKYPLQQAVKGRLLLLSKRLPERGQAVARCRIKKISLGRLKSFIGWLITFHFVVFLWIFFRAQSFQKAWDVIIQIAYKTDWAYWWPFIEVRFTWLLLVFIGFITQSVSRARNIRITEWFITSPGWVKFLIFLLTLQLVLQFRMEDVQPFIYFQF